MLTWIHSKVTTLVSGFKAVFALVWVLVTLTAHAGQADTALSFPIGGHYELTDQYGQTRTEKDLGGRYQLVFFGYVECPAMCSTALPLMADVVTQLSMQGHDLTPVVITIVPERDTVEAMVKPLAKLHPDFIGLTGGEEALDIAYNAYSIRKSKLFKDSIHGWIYSHGTFIHLLDPDGKVLALLRPTSHADHIANTIQGFLEPEVALK